MWGEMIVFYFFVFLFFCVFVFLFPFAFLGFDMVDYKLRFSTISLVLLKSMYSLKCQNRGASSPIPTSNITNDARHNRLSVFKQ